MILSYLGPLVIALVGAAFGAFLALSKNKNERLWLDRYETLKDIIVALNKIESVYEASYMEQLSTKTIDDNEFLKMLNDLPNNKISLRESFAKLRLLYTESENRDIREELNKLNQAFPQMFHAHPIDRPEEHKAIADICHAATEAAIALGQKNLRWQHTFLKAFN